MSFRIGLIGGIASGKSTALQYFKSLGIDTFNADEEARNLTRKNTPCFQHIREYFGNACLLSTGELDRSFLRQKLIQDPKFKSWLEDLLHPLIQHTLNQKMCQSKTPYCVVEIPLLKDKKTYQLNRVLYIKSSPSEQLTRLRTRGLSPNDIQGMLQAQINEKIREKLADDVIFNDVTLIALQQQLHQFHELYLSLADNKPF